jgi:RHS repeat-associated protein
MVFLMAFSSVAPAFASEESFVESISQETSESSLETTIDVEAPVVSDKKEPVPEELTDESAEKTKDKKPKEGEEEPDPEMMMMQSDQPQAFPSVALSTIKHQLPQSDAFSGALVYTYPLVVPPGRNGMQPDLVLSYNNQNTPEDTLFGMGWSVNIPYIERLNREGSEKLYTENYFTSSLSGELVDLGSGAFSAKVENGDFLSYTLSSNVWTVVDKKGVVYTFGASVGARQDNPSDSSKVYKWMLEEIRDTNDNYVKYEYAKDDAQIYPDTITYTGSGSTDGVFEVVFLRETRLDVSTGYKGGFAVITNDRISEIQTKVDGDWVKKYELDYNVGDNDNHSLIASITETGRDEVTEASVALPPTEFDYQVPEDSYAYNTDWVFPTPLSEQDNHDIGSRLVDLNADGLLDIVRLSDGPNQYDVRKVYLNDGEGWFDDTTNWTLPQTHFFSNSNGAFLGLQIADINGDNLPDLLYGRYGSPKKVFLHTGSGWVEDTNWVLPIYLLLANMDEDYGVRLVDVNADGLTDILHFRQSTTRNVYINNGSGWDLDTSWVIPQNFFFASSGGGHEGGKYVDVNGDGLVDLLHSYFGGIYVNQVFFNTGNGWELDSSWSLPIELTGSGGSDFGARFVDINVDGLTDIVRLYYKNNQVHQRNVYLNTGEGWVEDTNWVLPQDIFFMQDNGTDLGGRIGDINGDGLIDIFEHRQDYYSIQIVYLQEGIRADSLAQIDYPRGGITSITYKTSAQYFDGATQLNPDLPFVLDTLYQMTNSDGLGVSAMYEYQYEQGNYYYNDPFDRKFSGFGKVVKTDSADNTTTTFFHQGDASNSSQGEHNDDISKLSKIYRVEITDSEGDIYRKVINKWENVDLGADNDFVKLTAQVDFAYDGDSDHKEKASTYAYDNANGNITQKIDWGEVTGSDDGTFTDTGSDKFTTTVAYAENTTDHILGLPSQETVVDQSSAKVRESKFYYDQEASGDVLVGNLTKEERWIDSTNYIDVERSYNSYGLVSQEKDPRDKTTDYVYDTYNLYPATVTNALSQDTTYAYDYSSGQVKQVTDANTRVFQSIYDGLDRVVEEKQPDLTTPSTLVTKAVYTYTDLSVGAKTQQTAHLDGSTTAVDSYTYTDGFDRVIQTRQEAEDSNTFSVKDTVYNNVEQVHKESLPYFASGSANSSATTTADLLTTYSYDPLTRVTTLVNAIGTVTNAYDDWKHSITDLRGKTKHLYQDAYGRLVKVEEINASNTYTTNYEYNGNGNLTKITDALSNIRNFTYDGLGRCLTAQDLHASADATFGTWTYTYDDSGNVSSIVDPNSQTINYTYDDINRMLTEDYTGQGGTEVTNTYDSGTDGIGRLTSVASTGATTAYAYNALGLVKQEIKTIDSTNYQADYTFDRQGNILTIANPDSSQVKYAYNTAGQLETVQRKESTDGSFLDVITDMDYGPHGKMTYQANANGSATTTTFDATKLYRLSTRVTTIPGGDHIQDLAYTMDENGNITQIVDASDTDSSKTMNYTYDDLNRLLTAVATNVASGQSTYSHTYAYDAVGNITSKSDQGTYDYEGDQGGSYANPHAVTSIGGTDFTYDNNGNMLTVTGGLSNTWNYKNQLAQAVVGAVTTTYAYDHAGQRVKYANGTTTTLYPSKNYNIEGSNQVKHIFAGDQVVATVKGTGSTAAVFSVHTDHLSGSSAVTNSSGMQEEVMDYFPFGEIRLDQKAGTFDEQRKFSGHEYDAETELTYMNARYYKSDIGRFVSQDPAYLATSTDLADPQISNSYSYAKNNPLTYVDPDGREPVKAYVGTITTFTNLLNTSPSRVGQYKNRDAHNYMLRLGNTEWKLSEMRPVPTETPYFNTKEGRYVYTEKGGWVDMAHFMFYTGKAYEYKQQGRIDPYNEAIQDGFQQEFSDRFVAPHSSYSYEDLPSDRYGATFGVYYFNPYSDQDLGQQIQNYFEVVLKATDPQKAPNYSSLPEKDSTNKPSYVNRSTNPISFK